MKCTKAIILTAGYGTRRLPVSKAVDKCMLPLLNRPIVDYVVEDCIAAGVTEIYFVVSKGGGQQLKQYYSRDEKLENYLRYRHQDSLLKTILPPKDITFHYIEQDLGSGKYGTSIPVWLCRDLIEVDEHVLIVGGDQCLHRTDGGSEARDLIAAVKEHGADSGMVGVAVPEKEVEKYGIIKYDQKGNFVHIVEKPKLGQAPSNLNNASLYLFNKRMFEYVARNVEQPQENEYLLTDAINEFVSDGYSMRVMHSNAIYLDCGSVESWVNANNYLLCTGLAK